VKGSFAADEAATDAGAAGGCLTLDRPGKGPAQGGLSACGSAAGTVSVGTAPSMAGLWGEFSSTGMAGGEVAAADGYGAVAVHAKALAVGEQRALSITLGWHYPERSYLEQRVGNHYTTLHASSEAAAKSLDLEATVEAISTLHSVFFDSVPEPASPASGGLPEWLADILVNMLSHVRSAWWEEDGKWRQWEAYDCVNVDSVHNDGTYLTSRSSPTRRRTSCGLGARRSCRTA
jgi:non-lysosomal glucosylceramidase